MLYRAGKRPVIAAVRLGNRPTSHREAVEVGAFFGQTVDIGGFQVRMSMATKIAPASHLQK